MVSSEHQFIPTSCCNLEHGKQKKDEGSLNDRMDYADAIRSKAINPVNYQFENKLKYFGKLSLLESNYGSAQNGYQLNLIYDI